MKKYQLRRVLELACMAVCIGCFAACGGSQGNSQPTPTTEPTEEVEATLTPTTEPTKQPEAQADPSPLPGQLEMDSWDGVRFASVESEDFAQIVGKGVKVAYEDGRYVLAFEGKGGYLALPKDVFADVTEGFTIMYRYKATTDSTAGLFQTNLCGYGVGDTQWRDAPEISLATDGTFRLFVGGRTINGVYNANATYNNGVSGIDSMDYAEPGGHKTRYEATTKALSAQEWHDVVLIVAKTGVQIYLDWEEVTLNATDVNFDLASSLEYLFQTGENGKNILSEYVNTSFGNSVYSDTGKFEGYVDNISIYYMTDLQKIMVSSETPAYEWSFSPETIIDTAEEEYTADLTVYEEKKLTELTELKTVSPDGKTEVQFWTDDNGSVYYSVTDNGKIMIETSLIGMELAEGNLYEGLSVNASGIKKQEIKETYELFTGYNETMENHCNETTFILENSNGSFTFAVRVHDDGFAYRYENVTVGSGETVTVLDEKSEVNLTKISSTWAFELNGHYEGTYIKRDYTQLESLAQKLSTPMLVKNGTYWILITEAEVINNNGEFCASALETTRGSGKLNWAFGQRRDPDNEAKGDLDFPGYLPITEVNTVNGFKTPWRAFVISDDLNEFVNSSLITDLNPAADETLYADTSYIKPGKVAWSWWAEESAQGTYSKHVEYIDFAAENGWDYVCLDVGWRNFERKLSELCEYAKEKGVGIFVWVNYRDIKDTDTMEKLFAKWKEAGVVGLKTDYFESDETAVMQVMQDVAECCARNQLMVLYHGCVRPGGECRTYPNILSTEAVYGEENHKWSENPSIENCLLYPFSRNICGSMDYTPAGTKVDSEATHGFCLAQTIVYESALQHFAYAAASYKTYNGLALLNVIPTEWEESILLAGYPGEHITMARRNGENWFIGSMTAEARTVEINFDFLASGEYHVYLYGDKEDGTGLVLEELTVTAKDTLTKELQTGGGMAMIVTKGTIDTSVGVDENVNPSGYTYYEAESKENILSGAAVKASSAFCSGGQKVGYIGYAGNTLTFTNITVPEDGIYTLLIYYCSGENRKITLNVNGQTEYTVENLNSGDFVHTAIKEVSIELKAGVNTLELSNNNYYAPDIDRIAISETKQK